jgi:SAM-dependent methyltransferase
MGCPSSEPIVSVLAQTLRRRVARRRLRWSLADRRVPVSACWGFDRGLPIDRHYIESFLARFAPQEGYACGDLHGRVLEVGDRQYVDRFATVAERPGPGVVHHVDVLHENAANTAATVVGDVTDSDTLPAGAFDCIVATQVLCVIWEVRAALENLHRALKPGGVLLLTAPGITSALRPDRDHWGDWWRFTSSSLRRLLEDAFPGGRVQVEGYGNLQSATFFLHGLAAGDLSVQELDLRDPDYEVTIAGRAVKARGAGRP